MPSFVYNPVIGVDVGSIAVNPDIISTTIDSRWITVDTATTSTFSAAAEVGTTVRSLIYDDLIEPSREFFANNNIELRVDSKFAEESYDNPYENTEEWLSLLEEK